MGRMRGARRVASLGRSRVLALARTRSPRRGRDSSGTAGVLAHIGGSRTEHPDVMWSEIAIAIARARGPSIRSFANFPPSRARQQLPPGFWPTNPSSHMQLIQRRSILVLALGALPTLATAETPARASLSWAGVEADKNGTLCALANDCRCVVFERSPTAKVGELSGTFCPGTT